MRAYEYWEKEGRPDSQHLEHWLRAEEEFARSDRQAKKADIAGNAAAARDALEGQHAAELLRPEEASKAHRSGEDPLVAQKAMKAG